MINDKSYNKPLHSEILLASLPKCRWARALGTRGTFNMKIGIIGAGNIGNCQGICRIEG